MPGKIKRMSTPTTDTFGAADLALATALADAADLITSARFSASDLEVTAKPDRTPVTDADFAVEDRIRELLAELRPADQVVGEERGGEVGKGRCWLLDPIDGTKNFSRGVGVWATLIALLVDGEPVVGVASAPALGRRWWAARGQGAFTVDHRGTRRITVSGVADLADAYASTTEIDYFDDPSGWQRVAESAWMTRMFGDFWQHCLVAEGALDLAVDVDVSPWDMAALQVIVTEAGGAFTDLDGVERHDGGSGVSSNGLLHAAALRLLTR
jgi:histidinol-phosphatase